MIIRSRSVELFVKKRCVMTSAGKGLVDMASVCVMARNTTVQREALRWLGRCELLVLALLMIVAAPTVARSVVMSSSEAESVCENVLECVAPLQNSGFRSRRHFAPGLFGLPVASMRPRIVRARQSGARCVEGHLLRHDLLAPLRC